jgi:Ca2+-binding RTX toxin-like protein
LLRLVVKGEDFQVTAKNAGSKSKARTLGLDFGPTANPDSDSTRENKTVLIDVLANDRAGDGKGPLTITAASAPAGQGAASVIDGKVLFDPGRDFDHLALGDTAIVIVDYAIADESGASAASTVAITVAGANDGPVAKADSATTSRDSGVVIDVLANDYDPDDGALLTVAAASVKPGQGSVAIVENQIRFDPGRDFDHVGAGESALVYLRYTVRDEHGATASSTVAVTVTGREHRDENTPSDDGETLIGTKEHDKIDALGGDDSVFGLNGDDYLLGGAGSDFLSGEEGHDVLAGGEDDDNASGGQGDDRLSGEAGNDHLAGDHGHDHLSGGDGLDSLDGGSGDDVVEGGGESDSLFGEEGNDLLLGDSGNDSLFGDGGKDELYGGEGDDSLDGGRDDDLLDGGDGDDILSGGLGVNSLKGGLGRDAILADSTDGAQSVDGGDGDDSIRHLFRLSESVIATGSGRDSVELLHANVGKAAILVTDFQPGAEGDMFRLSGGEGAILSLLKGWDGSSNPFGSGFLRLEQSGSDTLLLWDRDGEGRRASWEVLAVFKDSDAGTFTDSNFEPGYHPDGSPPAEPKIVPTKGADTLTGTEDDDSIDALAGDDFVSGLGGADVIKGGDGLDSLYGDGGDDVLEGGNDDDALWGGEGRDLLFGDSGADALSGEAGDDALSGGDGDDSLDGGEGDDKIDGGEGDDFLFGGLGSNGLEGGPGHDRIVAHASDGAQAVDGGEGDDSIGLSYRNHGATIATGSGRDSIDLFHADIGQAAILVTDFTPGIEGDILRLSEEEGSILSLLLGWDGSSNPFGSGFLQLEQGESGALLRWDRDGEGREWDWETLVVFERTDARAFTDFNFAGFHPEGWAVAGQKIVGTGEDEILVGAAGDDVIEALGGSDSVFGRGGGDLLLGGDGADFLYGDGGGDALYGGDQDDTLSGGSGHDSLSGDSGNDILFGETGDDRLSGGDGDDSLDANDGDDRLEGGAGRDTLSGGAGADVLSGGLDSDIFAFHSSASGADEITDFAAGTDKILISAARFGGGLAAGGPVSLVSGTNPSASAASGQFLYDTDDGRLLWDADGTGGGAAVLVATLTSLPSLAASDFMVV